jgi:uroporphyrinogen-III synthase
MTRVLVLRPEPGATATAEKARAAGLEAVAVPLFTIEPAQWEAPDAGSFDGVLLTSANAVTFGGQALHSLRSLKVYAVGEATAQAAREAGFDIAASGDAGVDRLLGSINPDLKLLHLCGADRRDPSRAKQQITRVTVYRAIPVDAPDLSVAAGNIALIHSPRAGRRFAELIDDRTSISIVAISEAAADAAGQGWRKVETSETPTDDALLALAATLCNKPDPE